MHENLARVFPLQEHWELDPSPLVSGRPRYLQAVVLAMSELPCRSPASWDADLESSERALFSHRTSACHQWAERTWTTQRRDETPYVTGTYDIVISAVVRIHPAKKSCEQLLVGWASSAMSEWGAL